jgi:transcriptional regulator with XRE-family HTH domain
MARGKQKNPQNVRFGKRISELRKERKWTFVYFAEVTGLTESFLVRLEHGRSEPCLNTQHILAKSFDMTISELLKGV